MAAERTVLAWIRTALGFLAGGVALIYVPDLAHPAIKYSLGAVMVVIGTAVALTGGLRWRQTTRALQSGAPMPQPTAVYMLIGAIVALAVVLVAVAAFGGA